MPVDPPHTQDGAFEGGIPAHIPLTLLRTLKDLDTPEDRGELEQGNLSLNLQRRLGLSSVVQNQIHRYEEGDGDVSAGEVASLFGLIAKRVDAPQIFASTGHRIARGSLGGRGSAALRLGWRPLPIRLRRLRAWLRVRRIVRHLSPTSRIRVAWRSGGLTIEDGLPARATSGKRGPGCEVVTGIVDEVFQAYWAVGGRTSHPRCEAAGGEHCAWILGPERG